MELDSLLNKLDKVKKGGDGKFLAICPAHQDKEASLSITADHEKILVHCFAGCSAEAIMKSLGLTIPDLFLKSRAKQPERKKVVKTYDYKDETGEVLFQVCRLEPKGFQQRHKNGKGGWDWSMKGVRRVLYHLPDIIKAPEVYFVEGEKDCDNLWDCGLVATTSPGGANAWKDEYAECLIGKKVILIPDNDDAGHAYMRDMACSLIDKADLSCILLPSKDASDWLKEGHDPEELAELKQDIIKLLGGKQPKYELIDDAIVWKHKPIEFRAENLRRERTGLHGKAIILRNYHPLAWSVFNLERIDERSKLSKAAFSQLKPEVKNNYNEIAIKQDFDLFCAGLWEFYLSHYSPELIYGDETPLPLTFLLKPYILRGGGTIIFAAPGKGKSNTALLWAQSINCGINKFWQVTKAPVLVVNLERSKETIQRRLSSINKVLGLPAVTPLRILNARGKSLHEVIDACRRAIKQFDIKVVFLDSISRAGFGDLTENRPVNAIIDALSGLCDTWVALAHTPRSDESHVYGGVMFEAGADIVIKLASESSENNSLGVGYEITKSNDFAQRGQITWAMEFDETGLTGFRQARSYEFPEIEGAIKKPMLQAIREFLFEQPNGDATASEVADTLSLKRPNVSNILRQSGHFVQTRKEGRNVFYGVKETSI